MRSLRGRLLVWLLGAVVLVGVVVGALVYRAALAQANQFFDQQLRQTALVLRDQPFEYSSGPRQRVGSPTFSFVVQVWSLDGVRIYLSRDYASLPGLTRLGLSTVRTQDGNWRVFAVAAPTRIIQVAQPMDIRQHRAASLAFATLRPLVWLIPVLALLVWVGVGRALVPLRRLAGSLRLRRPDALEPLPHANLPDEVQPLVDALNDLLARLAKALESERAFLADAAHELRTPLTALHLQMETLARARDEQERAAATRRLETGVQRANRLIEQLLSLARHGQQGAAGREEEVKLDALARDVVGQLVPLADQRDIDLGVADAEPASVRGDRSALEALLRNLVDNAVRYTPPGGRVDVAVRNRREGGQLRPIVSVADTGPGIAPQERARVFDRFHRAPGTTAPGSGLGLAIVRSVAEAHHASVELGDVHGHGLCVSVLFPPGHGS